MVRACAKISKGAISASDTLFTPVFELDAGLAESYPGSGQILYNLTANPADGSAQSAYDFYLGATGNSEGTDPTWNPDGGAVAGGDSVNEKFRLQSPNHFSLKGFNTTFLEELHHIGSEFSFYSVMQEPIGALPRQTFASFFGTLGSAGNDYGISLSCPNSDNTVLQLKFGTRDPAYSQPSGGIYQILGQSSSGFIPTSEPYIIGVSYKETTGDGILYRRSASGRVVVTFNQRFSADYSAQPASLDRAEMFGAFYNNMRGWYRSGMYNKALSAGQFDILYGKYRTKKLGI